MSSTINKDEEISRCTIQVLRGYQKTETDGDSWLAEMGAKMGCKIRLLACHVYIYILIYVGYKVRIFKFLSYDYLTCT